MGDVGAAERRGRIQARRVGRDRLAGRGRVVADRRTAAAQILQRAARHPQQEQVEDGEEAELQRNRYGRERGHPSSKTISVEPSSRRSPGAAGCAPSTAPPLTRTPLVEPRSATVQPPALGTDLGVAAEIADVIEDDVAFAAAADRRHRRGDQQAAATDAEQRARQARRRWASCDGAAQARGSAVDHRLTVLLCWRGSRPRGASLLLTVTVRADQPRLDAEFPERQALVGVKRDDRVRGEDQLLAARVLEQVAAQLVDHLPLDSVVARTVLRREPHRVLVRR